MSWAEIYSAFVAGERSLSLLTLMADLRILVAVAFVHAVWQRSLTVATLSGFLAAAESGITASLPPAFTPVVRELCPSCTTSSFGTEVPVWILVVVAAMLCNAVALLDQNSDTSLGGDGHHGVDESTDALLPTTERQLGYLLATLSGYTLVITFLSIGIVSSPFVEALPNINWRTAGGLGLCALVFYEFVTTKAGFSLAALAAVVWHTSFAALQYDTALSEFLVPTATLLTISAVGFMYSKSIEFTRQRRRSTHGSQPRDGA
ncbi:hypothetical protein [Halobaculum sp. MBLA0143]|uniref:hypothetical protein n=1 Tax=Halobaculum sp. MBLA0143 TaxID=3079933 RepID=UPI00352634F6